MSDHTIMIWAVVLIAIDAIVAALKGGTAIADNLGHRAVGFIFRAVGAFYIATRLWGMIP